MVRGEEALLTTLHGRTEPAVLVEGRGLLGRAFAEAAEGGPDALVFARGVADSSCVDPGEYARETEFVVRALDRAADQGLPFVYFVGAPIYGDFREPVDEQTPIAPISPYGIHQARTEERIRAHRASHLLIRVPNVVGSGGNRHQLIPSLVRQTLAGSVVIQERAERDLIGVDSVVGAVRALLMAGIVNRTVVVASGISTPVPDIAAWLISELAASARTIVHPGGEAQQFRIDLLRALAPSAAQFESDYPRHLIQDLARRAPSAQHS